MVKRRKNNTRKNRNRKGFSQNRAKARKINASTPFETFTEQLSPFGGLWALIKFFYLVNFHEIFKDVSDLITANSRKVLYKLDLCGKRV